MSTSCKCWQHRRQTRIPILSKHAVMILWECLMTQWQTSIFKREFFIWLYFIWRILQKIGLTGLLKGYLITFFFNLTIPVYTASIINPSIHAQPSMLKSFLSNIHQRATLGWYLPLQIFADWSSRGSITKPLISIQWWPALTSDLQLPQKPHKKSMHQSLLLMLTFFFNSY